MEPPLRLAATSPRERGEEILLPIIRRQLGREVIETIRARAWRP
jgi:hypothetical protein